VFGFVEVFDLNSILNRPSSSLYVVQQKFSITKDLRLRKAFVEWRLSKHLRMWLMSVRSPMT